MFYLPIPIEGCSGEPVSVQKRQSRGYEYSIMKYERPTIGGQEPYTLVTNREQTKVFAYMAPRETIGFNEFKFTDYQEDDTVEVKDAIEGTMITFFWNDETEEWDICTRNGVGGDYSFMHPTNKGDEPSITFRQMVIDTFRISLMVDRVVRSEDVRDLNDVVILNTLSKTHCYTCILQHPANHIVYQRAMSSCFLKLVAVYEMGAMPPLVSPDSDVVYRDCVREIAKQYLQSSKVDEDDEVWQQACRVFGCQRTTPEFIRKFDEFTNFKIDVFNTFFDKMITNRDPICARDIGEHEGSLYYPPAWILTNNRTGQRCEIKNPFYESAKELRNIQPNMRYQYLILRKSNRLSDYVLAYPRYRSNIIELEKEYEGFITEVHRAYVKFYIKKERAEHIPKKYFVHAARIHHNLYLKQPAVPRLNVTREVVYFYFDRFSATKMFYFLTRTEEGEPEPTEEEEVALNA